MLKVTIKVNIDKVKVIDDVCSKKRDKIKSFTLKVNIVRIKFIINVDS